jgi:Uma2 family endonuclease
MSTRRAKVRLPKLRRSSNGMLMTPEEFDAVTDYDDRYSYELIHGVVIVNPIPAESESDPNEELGHLLRSYKENHPEGSALDATLSERYIAIGDSRRKTDRVIWAGLGRLPDSKTDVPTIAVEFVSKRSRDRHRDYEEKRREYLAVGVAEYWVIDRFLRVMTVYRRPPSQPEEQVIPPDGIYRTPLLPGFELPLARILATADQWQRRK